MRFYKIFFKESEVWEMTKNREVKWKKMFQRAIDYIKLYHFDDPTPHEYEFTAASMSAYILLHFHCDDFGRIIEKDFVLKELTDKYDLPYSSIHKGMALLFNLDMLSYVHINGEQYIQLAFYDNQPDEQGSMNYFILPTLVLNSDFLNASIKSRDTNGIIMMIDQMNSLYRQSSERGGGACRRKFKSWIRTNKKTKRNIIRWFEHLQNLVKVVKEKGTSILNTEVEITYLEEVFVEREVNKDLEITIAKIRKSVTHSFFYAQKYNYDRILDCTRALRHELVEPLFHAIQHNQQHIRTLELMAEEVTNLVMTKIVASTESIHNIGGYFRTQCRSLIQEWYPQLDMDFQVDVIKYYRETKQPLLSYMKL